MRKPRSERRFLLAPRGAAAALVFVLLAEGGEACARADCEIGPKADAALNAASVASLPLAPFRRPEAGWGAYETLVAHEIATDCPASSPAFAAALSRWRRANGLAGAGVMDAATFSALVGVWQERRPFVAASRLACPAPPPETSLATARAQEGYLGKIVSLRPRALAAYRAMVAAARAQAPQFAADRRLLTLLSGYRSPAYDNARCARDGDCQGVTRSACSAHRTALAVDLYLGAAPGFGPDSSDDASRLYLSRTVTYQWLARNAGRFGFVNYPFEPWHWEWTGEAP